MKERNDIMNNERDFLQHHTVDFQKSKQEEWCELQAKIGRKTAIKTRILQFSMGIAASVLLALGLLTQFYEKSCQTVRGQQQYCELPDGSKVFLNAETKITYKPLKWYFAREVQLAGEAFFEVQKGSRFTVHSPMGKTQVLGTSFNIYARNNEYKVACVTGKVEVRTQGKKVTLTPGEAVIGNEAKKTVSKTKKEQNSLLAWKSQRLIFKAQPLRNVFDALERQYNVYIAYYPNGEKLSYSGNISLKNKFEDNLSIVCKTFQKQWTKSDTKERKKLYIIND